MAHTDRDPLRRYLDFRRQMEERRLAHNQRMRTGISGFFDPVTAAYGGGGHTQGQGQRNGGRFGGRPPAEEIEARALETPRSGPSNVTASLGEGRSGGGAPPRFGPGEREFAVRDWLRQGFEQDPEGVPQRKPGILERLGGMRRTLQTGEDPRYLREYRQELSDQMSLLPGRVRRGEMTAADAEAARERLGFQRARGTYVAPSPVRDTEAARQARKRFDANLSSAMKEQDYQTRDRFFKQRLIDEQAARAAGQPRSDEFKDHSDKQIAAMFDVYIRADPLRAFMAETMRGGAANDPEAPAPRSPSFWERWFGPSPGEGAIPDRHRLP